MAFSGFPNCRDTYNLALCARKGSDNRTLRRTSELPLLVGPGCLYIFLVCLGADVWCVFLPFPVGENPNPYDTWPDYSSSYGSQCKSVHRGGAYLFCLCGFGVLSWEFLLWRMFICTSSIERLISCIRRYDTLLRPTWINHLFHENLFTPVYSSSPTLVKSSRHCSPGTSREITCLVLASALSIFSLLFFESHFGPFHGSSSLIVPYARFDVS